MSFPTLLENGYEVVDTATMAVSQRLIACLNNERMTDVFLVGEDNVKVAASKYILGSLSPTLQTLLYNGAEGSSVIIEDCRVKTLQALVEFSCSDMLNTNIWADTEPVEIVEDMVALAKLAEMYALPNLKHQVAEVLCPCLVQLPSLACVAFNLVDTTTTKELHAAAVDVLRKKASQAFAKGPGGEIGGVSCLSPDKLLTLFADNEVNADEIFLFQCLVEWRDDNIREYDDAEEIAMSAAQHLDFSAMNASDIEGIVLPSGIVDSQLLLNGLMTVAKAAEKKGIALRSARRTKSSAAKQFDSNASDTNSTNGRSIGRRFKKVNSPGADAPSVATNDETRQAPTGAPVSEVRATSKKMAIKSQRGSMKARASKFLGSMRSLRPLKESSSERSVDDSVQQLSTLMAKKETAREPALSEMSSLQSASGSNAGDHDAAPGRTVAQAIAAEAAE